MFKYKETELITFKHKRMVYNEINNPSSKHLNANAYFRFLSVLVSIVLLLQTYINEQKIFRFIKNIVLTNSYDNLINIFLLF